MKINIITPLFAAVLLLVASGCKKELTTTPTTAVSESLIYGDVNNIEKVLNGTWAYMNDTYFTYANPGYSTILRTSDAMGDDVAIITNKYGYRDAYEFTLANNQTRLDAIWTILYKVIDNCNNIITRIDAAEGSAEKKAQIKGQALALRANSYLTLATYYQFSYLKDPNAKAVPIYTQPTNSQTQGKPKSTLEEVYTLINADLAEAETLLQNYTRPGGAKYKINLDVVHGLQARTFLNTGKWASAAKSAAEARKNYSYMSAANYAAGFNDLTNGEWIWGHGQQPDQNTASYSFHFLDVTSPNSYYYSFMADPNFKLLFEDNDIRSKLFSWDEQAGREGYLRYGKFKFRPDETGDIVLMRSSEMTLIQAEASARNGDLNSAVQYLNELRQVRNAAPFSSSGNTATSIIDAILVERRKELWGEGFALSDILRTQTAVVRKPYTDATGQPVKINVKDKNGNIQSVSTRPHTTLKFPDGSAFVPNSPYYLFKIPQSELNTNPDINK